MSRPLVLIACTVLALPVQIAAQDPHIEDVDFCATVSRPVVPLGMKTTLEYFVWNRGAEELEYYVPPLPIPHHYPTVLIEHAPPSFKTLKAGQFVLHSVRTPEYGGFSADLAGDYVVPVTLQLKGPDGVEERVRRLAYRLVDDPPPDRYVVKTKLIRTTSSQRSSVVVSYLDDSAYRRESHRALERIMSGRSQDSIEDYLEAKRQWYETPYGHRGFGEPDDWAYDVDSHGLYTLFLDLEDLIGGIYSLDTIGYRSTYEAMHEARKKYGLSPYFAVKQAIYVFREHGREAALKYLGELETAQWSCVDMAIRDYVIGRISSWDRDERPSALVYTKELQPKLRRGSDGRLRLEGQSNVERSEGPHLP